ncbi:MAG: histidine kinase [Alphaproteobacteria bacterium]|nr:histidine kinase [Alphaproteobacteria bacterium]
MTHFLVNDDNPDGHQLEDVLAMVQSDLVKRAALIADDERQEARKVLANDISIMAMLSECVALAEESTTLLNRAFGPSRAGQPRIGSGG